MRHQKDLQEKEGEVTQKIFERMQRIILRIASSENFTMVLDKNQAGIIFAKQHLDLTNEVIRKYNDAGYDEIYVNQIGPDQRGFFDFFERELQPLLQ
jgi:hypothetical protein